MAQQSTDIMVLYKIKLTLTYYNLEPFAVQEITKRVLPLLF